MSAELRRKLIVWNSLLKRLTEWAVDVECVGNANEITLYCWVWLVMCSTTTSNQIFNFAIHISHFAFHNFELCLAFKFPNHQPPATEWWMFLLRTLRATKFYLWSYLFAGNHSSTNDRLQCLNRYLLLGVVLILCQSVVLPSVDRWVSVLPVSMARQIPEKHLKLITKRKYDRTTQFSIRKTNDSNVNRWLNEK